VFYPSADLGEIQLADLVPQVFLLLYAQFRPESEQMLLVVLSQASPGALKLGLACHDLRQIPEKGLLRDAKKIQGNGGIWRKLFDRD